MHRDPTNSIPAGTFGSDRGRSVVTVLAAVLLVIGLPKAAAQATLRARLRALPFKIAYESYVHGNWDIYVANADGSGPVNLTATPNENEHYPQVSRDGRHICFASDTGTGRDIIRSVYVMDTDGRRRRRLAERARQPFWTQDGQAIGYLPQLYPIFRPNDGYTDGMAFYNLATGKTTPHPASAKLHQLYNPSYDPGGRWIAATVHGGMGIGHAIILVATRGMKIVKLNIPGCRPCLSPDGNEIAWGASDHELVVAPLDLNSDHPQVGPWRLRITDATNKIYHVDWSPDGHFLSFSRGPAGEGDPNRAGTYQVPNEMIGAYAPGWNIDVVAADRTGTLDLNRVSAAEVVELTTNGCSNKEPAWFRDPIRSSQ